jgi:hypothetical protein
MPGNRLKCGCIGFYHLTGNDIGINYRDTQTREGVSYSAFTTANASR